jgi:hypothetical protein
MPERVLLMRKKKPINTYQRQVRVFRYAGESLGESESGRKTENT